MIYRIEPLDGNGMKWAGMGGFQGVRRKLNIAGSTAHLPVIIEAAMRNPAFNADINFNVARGGTACGISKVGEGLVDIGKSGRALTDAERER